MQLEGSVAQKNLSDMRQLVEVVIHAFYLHHSLSAVIDSQRLVLHTLGGNLYLRQLTYLRQHRVVGRCRLSLCRSNLYLGIKSSEKRSHQVAEAIKHAQRHHQRHRSYSHAQHRDATDEVDDVGRFLREDISPCYIERKIHAANSSLITFSLLEQFVDVLNIVQTVVQEEAQLRDDAQLMAHALSQ